MQTKCYNPVTEKNDVLTVIEISRETPATGHEKARKLDAAIGGNKSYMNFKVSAWPYNGEIGISVETVYPASEKKIREFLTFLMFSELTK